MRWRRSPKGYTTSLPDGRRATVFFKSEINGWVGVVDRTYGLQYTSVFEAIDEMETTFGFKADRFEVEDVPPTMRGPLPKKPKPDPRAAAAADEARRKRRQEAEEKRQEWYRRYAQDFERMQAGARKTQQKPEWALVLELPGSGPWKADFVKAQFRTLSKKYHPDVGGDTDHMAKIIKAWSTVKNLFSL